MQHLLSATEMAADGQSLSNTQIAKFKSAYIVKTARSVTLTNVLAPLFALVLFYDDAEPDLPPASRTKAMAVSPQILENCGYEDHTIYR